MSFLSLILLGSLERIQQFTRIDQEPVHANFIPPAYWPSSGALVVENLSARYSTVILKFHNLFAFANMIIKDGPLVLQGISFRIEPGERIGLGTCRNHKIHSFLIELSTVGRTGSGKVNRW